MKSKLLLATLAIPMFCLTACGGGSNDICNKTFVYKGVISNLDYQLYEGDTKTERQWFTQEFNNNNIDWTGSDIPHSSVDEVIKFTDNDSQVGAKKIFGDTKLVVGSKESKKATITFRGETGEYTFDPDKESGIYDFKDSSGSTYISYCVAKIVNGIVEKGYIMSGNTYASVGYKFPLLKPTKTTEGKTVEAVSFQYVVNVTNQ